MPLAMMETFAGREIGRVPFWEVWYAMVALTERLLGTPGAKPEDQCRLAEILGCDVIHAGGIGINAPGGRWSLATDGTSHYVQSGLAALEGLDDRPLPDYSQALEQAIRAATVAHEHGLAAVLYVPWCFHVIGVAIGLEALAYAVYDNRGLLHDAFEWVEQRTRTAIQEVVIPSGVDFVLFDGDCAFKNGLMVRPDIFRELVCDRTAKTVEPLRQAGIPYVLHSDGKLDDLIPLLIELGFTAVHGVEAAANDLSDIKARFGRDITLIGNMDVVALTHSTMDEVREMTRAMLRTGAPGGRYVAACNTSPLDYIPQDNYLAFCEEIRNFRP